MVDGLTIVHRVLRVGAEHVKAEDALLRRKHLREDLARAVHAVEDGQDFNGGGARVHREPIDEIGAVRRDEHVSTLELRRDGQKAASKGDARTFNLRRTPSAACGEERGEVGEFAPAGTLDKRDAKLATIIRSTLCAVAEAQS